MSTYSFLVLYLLLPILVRSCSTYDFHCGNYTLEIRYPFVSDPNPAGCSGLHHVQCLNLVPLVKLYGEGFLYTLWNISYSDNSFVIHDVKLSSYFRGSNCMFLYDFTSPVPRFNVSNVTEYLSSSQGFFNCDANGYGFSHDVFRELYNLAPCKDYSLDYLNNLEDQTVGEFPSYCETSSGIWFDWRLAFDEHDGNVSLLSAGFSPKWTPFPDCFSCQIAAGNCSNQCRGVTPSGGHSHTLKTVIGLCLGFAIFLIGSSVFILQCRRHKKISGIIFLKKRAKGAKIIETFLEKYGSLATKRYTYLDVKKMTKSFSEKLGQGGYGSVYKGKLFDGHLVAVKVLNVTKGNGEDFISEVAAIGNTSHVNVVSLRGFCVEGSKRALIYDFMPNGSLDKYISSKKLETDTFLGWEKLCEIAIGVARGLEYLHRGCNTRIVHFDIKPHNILLDQDFCPKISDFGMAKLCPPKQSIVSLYGARGTIGYIAPEVFSRTFGVVSGKSDVYSYGMMLLEMFGGKINVNTGLESTSEAYFPQSIYHHLDNKDDLVEYEVTSETEKTARKMMIVGFWCIQTLPDNRPSMSRVVEMLEGSINDLPIPPKPILSSPLDLVAGSWTISSFLE